MRNRPHVPKLAALPIHFDRMKYGRRLLADAFDVTNMPGFIKTPDPHRLAFHEIVLVTNGHGTVDLDGTPLEVAPYRLCITAPGEVRSWRLRGDRLDGLVAFFETELFTEFFADPSFIDKFPVLAMDAPRRSMALSRKRFDELAGIVGAMQDELRCVQADSGHVLRAQAYLLLTALQRQCGARAAEPVDKARVVSLRYSALVEKRFLHNDSVADYAALLGVTPRHLKHCVRAATGSTPGEIFQRRLHLEACRLLLNTDLDIVEVAQVLNFSDPSYFNRFFRRHAGTTPRTFRVQHGSPIFSPDCPLRGSDR
ncbi:MAG: AraC family transcriptional regulator [Betaproteobacteria bacterium]